MSYVSHASDVIDTNRTLRNTFMLLSLTLIPTVFGAWFGMVSGLNAMLALHPIAGFLGFMAIAILLIVAIVSASAAEGGAPVGVFLLLLFTFVMGAMISGGIEAVLQGSNGPMIVAQAVGGTAIVTFSCGLYAMVTKRDFSSIGGALFGILLAVIVVSIVNMFLQLPMLTLIISVVTLILFSVYLIFDVQQVVNGGEDNYILATLNIYLDILNIFMSLLQILNFFGGGDDD